MAQIKELLAEMHLLIEENKKLKKENKELKQLLQNEFCIDKSLPY